MMLARLMPPDPVRYKKTNYTWIRDLEYYCISLIYGHKLVMCNKEQEATKDIYDYWILGRPFIYTLELSHWYIILCCASFDPQIAVGSGSYNRIRILEHNILWCQLTVPWQLEHWPWKKAPQFHKTEALVWMHNSGVRCTGPFNKLRPFQPVKNMCHQLHYSLI